MQATAVLLSGGLDSAVLLDEEVERAEVQPIYVRVGVAWEALEHEAVERFLTGWAAGRQVRPLVSLSVDMTDVYHAAHWSRQGRPPGYHTPDEDVYLPGRNIVLLGKAGVYCAGAGIARLVIGTLDHNPFPDATPAFRQAMASTLSLGLGHQIEIDAPYARTEKAAVIARGHARGVPLHLTLSCMNPVAAGSGGPSESGGSGRAGESSSPHQPYLTNQTYRARGFPRHCGRCSKCRERHDAFLDAEVEDPTDYADVTNVRAGRSA